MSLFGALNTAVSGLSAQSAAFGNISDNVANSQTVGYKAVNTNFIDYLTTSTATAQRAGAGDHAAQLHQQRAGNDHPEQRSAGAGDLRPGVLRGVRQTARSPAATDRRPSARRPTTPDAGDFQMNNNGYLVNGAGEYLQGWTVNPQTGVANQSQLAPIQITQTQFNPVSTVATSSLSANLPATPAADTPMSSQVDVYDSLGNAHASR